MVTIAQHHQTHNVFTIPMRRCVQWHKSFIFAIGVENIYCKIGVDFLEAWNLSNLKREAQPLYF